MHVREVEVLAVYCSGPYCNRSKIVAAAFARLGYAAAAAGLTSSPSIVRFTEVYTTFTVATAVAALVTYRPRHRE